MTAEPKIQAARRVFIITLILNLLVSFSELAWGYWSHTLSLTADGFHSLLDAGSNIIGIIALSLAMQPADTDHPYGHRKFEAMGSMVISFFIFLTAFHIAGEAIQRVINPAAAEPDISVLSYLIKAFGLGCNFFVVWYESKKARELKSSLLATDSKHTLSDILVSLSVILSMVMVQLGLLWVDTVAAVAITLIIFRVGFNIIVEHMGVLVDEAVLDPEEVCAIVMQVPGVLGCHKIRSRGLHDNVFLDLHVQVHPDLTIREGHQISYQVESALEAAFRDTVKDVLVHIEEQETP